MIQPAELPSSGRKGSRMPLTMMSLRHQPRLPWPGVRPCLVAHRATMAISAASRPTPTMIRNDQ